jgi:hypothetical protein
MESIAVAVAEAGRSGEVRSLGTIPNDPQAVRRLLKKIGPVESLHVCYEAGPCGYGLYWQLDDTPLCTKWAPRGCIREERVGQIWSALLRGAAPFACVSV